MALKKDGKYWKIVDIKVNRQLKKATVILVAFIDEADANKPKLAQFNPHYKKRIIKLEKENYPFIDEASPNQTALTYVKVKAVNKYFADAEDI